MLVKSYSHTHVTFTSLGPTAGVISIPTMLPSSNGDEPLKANVYVVFAEAILTVLLSISEPPALKSSVPLVPTNKSR